MINYFKNKKFHKGFRVPDMEKKNQEEINTECSVSNENF